MYLFEKKTCFALQLFSLFFRKYCLSPHIPDKGIQKVTRNTKHQSFPRPTKVYVVMQHRLRFFFSPLKPHYSKRDAEVLPHLVPCSIFRTAKEAVLQSPHVVF